MTNKKLVSFWVTREQAVELEEYLKWSRAVLLNVVPESAKGTHDVVVLAEVAVHAAVINFDFFSDEEE